MTDAGDVKRISRRGLIAYVWLLVLAALLVPARNEAAFEVVAPLLDWIPMARRHLELSGFPLATAVVMVLVLLLSPLPIAFTRDRISLERLRAQSFGQILKLCVLFTACMLGALFMALQDGYSAEMTRLNVLPALMFRHRLALAFGAPFLGFGLSALAAICWEAWREAFARI